MNATPPARLAALQALRPVLIHLGLDMLAYLTTGYRWQTLLAIGGALWLQLAARAKPFTVFSPKSQ